MASETLHWTISGEFITNIARQWFWEENKKYDVCEELLLSCLVNPQLSLEERKCLARDILEGRKRLVGNNEFTIEEDGENVRSLTEKINQLARRNSIHDVERDIMIHPLRYIDPYSTVKSIKSLEEGITRYRHNMTQENIREYFTYPTNVYTDEPDYDNPYPAACSLTEAGLWLWNRPDLIHDICDEYDTQPDTDAFWEGIYEYTKDREGFEERNQRYRAAKRLAEERIIIPETPPEKGEIRPDDIQNWTGLVAPNGDFYSCEFAEHTSLAYKIIISRPEEFPNESLDNIFMFDKVLDVLINGHKWVALRKWPMMGNYITFPDNNEITKEQKNTIWKAIVKHDVHMKIPDILM